MLGLCFLEPAMGDFISLFLGLFGFVFGIYWFLISYRALLCVPKILSELEELRKEVNVLNGMVYKIERRDTQQNNTTYLD